MESGHLTGANSEFRTHPDTSISEGVHLLPHGKKLSSHSSSSSSTSSASDSSGDPFALDDTEISKFPTGINAPPQTVSFMPKDEPSSHFSPVPPPVQDVPDDKSSTNYGSTTQYPPVQVMERAGDVATTPSYRIPSSVFARTKSTSPVDWSVCSNESLFSIHMGNTSFNKDPLFWNKSGELGKPGDPNMFSPFVDYSSNTPPPPVNKSTELERRSGNLGVSVGTTETVDPQKMEVIRESEENQSKDKLLIPDKSPRTSSLSRTSDGSGASMKSFAFPILTGDSDKSGPLKGSDEKKMQQSQSLSQPQTPKGTPKAQPQTPKETPKSEPQTPKAKPETAQSSWFSCFSCCPFCS